MSNMQHLWSEFDTANQEVAVAERKREKILKQIREAQSLAPTPQEVKICLAAANGQTLRAIAADTGLSKSTVGRITKSFMPTIAGAMHILGEGVITPGYNDGDGSVDGRVDVNWDAIDNDIDDDLSHNHFD